MEVYDYRTERCPACGETVEQRQVPHGSTFVEGSPYRVCPHCQASFFDPGFREPALVYYERELRFSGRFLPWLFLAAAGGLCSFAAFCLSLRGGQRPEGWQLSAVLSLVSCIAPIIALGLGLRERKRSLQAALDLLESGRAGELDRALAESMERLGDAAYLDSLRAHGAAVPEYFFRRLEDGAEP